MPIHSTRQMLLRRLLEPLLRGLARPVQLWQLSLVAKQVGYW